MSRYGPQWPEPGNALDGLVDDLVAKRERRESRRLWAAVVLARDVHVCESILAGRPVIASKLDPRVLHAALRGAPLPPPSAYVVVSPEMLDAVAEHGAFA